MKALSHRIVSVLLALAMVLSCFAFTAAAAQKNQGTRYELCTALSSQAKAYYKGEFSPELLGTYETDTSGSCLEAVDSELYRVLQQLMTETHTHEVNYKGTDGLQDHWPSTDCQNGDGKMVMFYSDGSGSFNREHVWPKSRASFYQSEGGSDLHHLRPTIMSVNTARLNYTFAELKQSGLNYEPYDWGGTTVLWYNASYTENSPQESSDNLGLVEVRDCVKGDVARILLYVYTRWEEKNLFENDPNAKGGTSTDENNGLRVIMDLETLLHWCEIDPVDTWEMGRNDATQEIQGNRNVFIDYPELAWLLFGEVPPADMDVPEPLPLNLTNYEIKASSNNSAWGTVTLDGRRITAEPKEGYYVADYTLVKGSATVLQNGNVFTVKAESDCEIRINFAAKTPVTVSFNGVAASIRGYAGEAVILPEGAEEQDYRFVGWVESPVKETEEKPVFYGAGSEYVPMRDTTLYALYSFLSGGDEPGWTLVEEESKLYSGAILVIASVAENVVAGDVTSSYMTEVSMSFPEDPIYVETMPEKAVELTLGGSSGAWTLTNEAGQLLGCSNAKNVGWDKGVLTWDIRISGDNASILSTNGSYGKLLHNISATRFTTYTSNPNTTMVLPQLYMNGGGKLYYTTELTRCEHETMSYTDPKAATCTAGGNVAYYTCTACGRFFADQTGTEPLSSAQLTIPALGHEAGEYRFDTESHWQICTRCGEVCTEKEAHIWDKGTVTTEPTEDREGVTTYCCETCDGKYTEAIPALGQKLKASFSVPKGVDAVASLYAYAEQTVTLPHITGTPGEKYTFLGWTTERVADDTASGTFFTAGEEYTLTENVTFYALFSYSEKEGDGPEVWALVESAEELTVGAKLVLASNSKGKTAGDISSAVLTRWDTEFTADQKQILSLPAEALILTLGGQEGQWTLANSAGRLLGATALKKLAWDEGSTTWNISVEGENATVYNTNKSYGRFLYNAGSPRFTTYTSSTGTSMLLPQLYMQKGGATTYYTTELEGASTEPTVVTGLKLGHTLNLASDISVNYAVATSLLQDYDSYYLECVLPVYEGNTLAGSRSVIVTPVLKGNYYYFTLLGVTAVNMNDTITATLHLTKDGAEFVTEAEEYSVATYAYAQLAKASASDKLKALCASLLRYGASAQIYKNYRTDSLADSAMTDAHRAYLTELSAVTFGNNNRELGDLNSPVVLWVGKSLLLDSKVTLRYVMNAASYTGRIEDLTLRISYRDYTGAEKTATVTGAQPYGTAQGRYCFDFDGLLAAELRCVLSAAVYSGNTRLSNTLEYSVDTYGNNKTGTLDSLCRALIAYSDSALSYFN